MNLLQIIKPLENIYILHYSTIINTGLGYIFDLFSFFCSIRLIEEGSRWHLMRVEIIMRTTQLELTELRRTDKALDFKQIDPDIQENISKLLNRQSRNVSAREHKSLRFWLYINPLSSFTVSWNLFFILVFYILQLQISLSLAFGPHFVEKELAFGQVYYYVYVFIAIFLAIDSASNFFKGYYAFGKGKVIDDIKKIIPNYLKGQFILDMIVLSIYLVPLFHQDKELNFLQLIPGALIWKKKFMYQHEIISYQVGLRIFFMVFVLFADILMAANYGACIFIGLDLLLYNQQYYGDSDLYYWLTNTSTYQYSLINGPWYYQYIYGLEFAAGTLSTLASGPYAKNPWEVVYTMILMILFIMLASYAGDVLLRIIYTHSERRFFHQENILSFDRFMKLKAVEKSIRTRIYNFFELIWEIELKMQSKEQEAMIDKLPSYLKEDLLLEIGFTKSIYFLSYLPQQLTIQKMIALKLVRSTIDSDTCIFEARKQKTLTSRNIYFIKEGMAKFYLADYQISKQNQNQKNLDILNKVTRQKILNLSNVERVLGTYEFITGQDYSICCKSIDICLIQKLSYTNFIEIINEIGIWEDYKKFQHQVLIEREINLIQKICIFCLDKHIEAECPKLYINHRFKQQLNDNHHYRLKQTRKPASRKPIKSRKIYEQVQDEQRLNVFSIFFLFKEINIGQLILEVGELDDWYQKQIEKVTRFTKYYPEDNLEQS